ncbi:MAG: penicillin acylase family protein [Polyangiales bacterium]
MARRAHPPAPPAARHGRHARGHRSRSGRRDRARRGSLPPFLAAAMTRSGRWTTPGTHADLSALATALQPRQARLRDAAQRIAMWSLTGESGVGDNVTDAQRSDAVATTLFHGWMVALIRGTFGDEQTAVNTATMSSLSFDGVAALLHLLEHPTELHALDPMTNQSALWDDLSTTDVRETRDVILLRALDTAMTELARVTRTDDVAQWLWGPLHTVRFGSLIPGTGAELSIPPEGDATFPNGFPRHGGLEVVDASHPGLGSYNFSYGSGPSQRFTVDLDPAGPVAHNVIPGGQSMDNTSPHFRDGAELWRMNRSHRVWILERDVAANASRRDRFEPMP